MSTAPSSLPPSLPASGPSTTPQPRMGFAPNRYRQIIKPDGSRRSLALLALTASSMRVLNLANVAALHFNDPDYKARPFFPNRVLNTAIILKHRLRSNEGHFFNDGRRRATKVIIPLAREDLTLGGFSVFVGERAWIERLHQYVPEISDTCAEVDILRVLDEAPTLDPFLLGITMERAGYRIAPCYFGLPPSDVERMRRFVATEMSSLIRMAIPDARVDDLGTVKLVNAIMTDGEDERFQMLSHAMRMTEEEFKDGLFAWKGFLYYKWQHRQLLDDATYFMTTLAKLKVVGPIDPETALELNRLRNEVRHAFRNLHLSVASIIGRYDDSYRDLTENGRPNAFREFMFDAPGQFTILSEAIGVASDLVSYWRHQFPPPLPPALSAEAACIQLREMSENLTALMSPSLRDSEA